VHHLIIEGDLAAVHWTMTWDAPDSAGAPSGRMRGHDFFRLREGRISEVWHCEAIQP
jgi:predicted SnoaL-like aldol condensation-catalyzing enzyme